LVQGGEAWFIRKLGIDGWTALPQWQRDEFLNVYFQKGEHGSSQSMEPTWKAATQDGALPYDPQLGDFWDIAVNQGNLRNDLDLNILGLRTYATLDDMWLGEHLDVLFTSGSLNLIEGTSQHYLNLTVDALDHSWSWEHRNAMITKG